MKVAFFSNTRGKSCVTSNLACISVLSVLRRPKRRIVVLENHQNIINLGNIWINPPPQNHMVSEKTEYKISNGNKAVLHSFSESFSDEKKMEEDFLCYAEPIIENRLFYLPIGNQENPEMLAYRFATECGRTLRFLEQFADLLLVDVSASPRESTRKVLSEADLVVVNLNQNRQMIEHFFRNYSEIRKKAFYLIGNYDKQSGINRDYLIKTYGIKEKRVGIIPHCTSFADAVSDGKIIPFLEEKYRCLPTDEVYFFICEARRAERLLFETLCEAKEREKSYEGKKKKGRFCVRCNWFDGDCLYPFRG